MTSEQVIESGTLLVLALLATAILRDRWRQEPVETAIRESFTSTAALPGRLERLEGVVDEAGRALQDLSVVHVLNGAEEIAKAHAEGRRETDRWSFKGGTGTYFRAVTLPECVAAARKERARAADAARDHRPGQRARSARPTPTTAARCRRARRHRRDVWTPDRASKESYATILAACWYRQRFGLLDIDIGPVVHDDHVPLGPLVGITDHHGRGPPSGRSWLAGRHLLLRQLHTELRPASSRPSGCRSSWTSRSRSATSPRSRRCAELFETLGLPLPRSYTDRDIGDLTRKALRAKNPYL